MPLTEDQLKFQRKFEQLARIDDELDEIRTAEGALDRRRRELSERRFTIENDLRLAYHAIGSPGTVVYVGDRMVLFEFHRTGIQTFKAISPQMFAVMATPTPTIEPCEPELLVPHSVPSIEEIR